MSFIELDHVSYTYPGGFLAIDDVCLSIEQGETVAIIGQNGAGKTTTAKLCNGLLRCTGGRILVDGKDSSTRTTAEISKTVGYVFQNPDDQIFHSTVVGEVEFGPKTLGFSPERTKELVDYALEVTALTPFRDENPYNLPLSIRKFITIAAIISMDTQVMIFDEPTAGQDLVGNQRLGHILGELSGKGKTVVTISHDMEFVANYFKRVIVMANKKKVTEGTPDQIFWNFPALEEARLMQPYVSRLCRSLGLDTQLTTLDAAVDCIAGQYEQRNP